MPYQHKKPKISTFSDVTLLGLLVYFLIFGFQSLRPVRRVSGVLSETVRSIRDPGIVAVVKMVDVVRFIIINELIIVGIPLILAIILRFAPPRYVGGFVAFLLTFFAVRPLFLFLRRNAGDHLMPTNELLESLPGGVPSPFLNGFTHALVASAVALLLGVLFYSRRSFLARRPTFIFVAVLALVVHGGFIFYLRLV